MLLFADRGNVSRPTDRPLKQYTPNPDTTGATAPLWSSNASKLSTRLSYAVVVAVDVRVVVADVVCDDVSDAVGVVVAVVVKVVL